VEQDRFVVRPFQMGRQSDPEGYQQAALNSFVRPPALYAIPCPPMISSPTVQDCFSDCPEKALHNSTVILHLTAVVGSQPSSALGRLMLPSWKKDRKLYSPFCSRGSLSCRVFEL
jgi:hypothetical protein